MHGLHLHLDCASGIAGDMTLAALLDVGVPEAVVRDALDRVGVGGWRLQVRRVVKRGIAAVDVTVDTKPDHDHDHGHHHQHDHDHDHAHAHHHYAEIRPMVEKLDGETRRRALDMFDRVARAEATLHGTTVNDVVFHEVGAIDSIVDIVGTAAALAWLGPATVSCASVAMGHGTITCAHGVLPVPAPAAIRSGPLRCARMRRCSSVRLTVARPLRGGAGRAA